MSIQHGNRGVVKKDLQLYYNREYNGSFLGEATMNFFSIPAYTLQKEGNHATSFSTSTSNGIPDLIVSGNKQVYYAPEYYTLVATGAWLAETNRLIIYPKLGSGATSYVPNGTYNFSFYARSLSGNTVLQYSFYNTTPRSTATLTTKWQRFNGTFTITNGPLTLLEFGNLNAGSMVCQIACIQVEAKSYATPFTVPVLWTPNLVNVTSTSGHTTMTKNTGDGWTNSRVYSSEGYNEPCYVSFKANAINKSFMVALNSDPATGINYTNLDYAWYADSNTIPQVYENGSQIAVYSTYTTSTLFEIIYNGVNVKYYMDGVLKYTSLIAPTLPLYLDSSFYTLNAQVVNLSFGPLSQINRFSNYVIGGGGLKDISGNNVNADLTNVSFDSSGYIFAGSQYVNVSSLITGNQSFSWGAWIYPTATGTPVFFGNVSTGLAMVSYWDSANNKVRVGTYGNDRLTSGTAIPPSTWGYTFWTWDGTTLTSYTNGIADGTATGFSFNISNLYTTIGNAVNAQYFTGRIAQTLVYNRALSAAEVSQNFNATRKTYGI